MCTIMRNQTIQIQIEICGRHRRAPNKDRNVDRLYSKRFMGVCVGILLKNCDTIVHNFIKDYLDEMKLSQTNIRIPNYNNNKTFVIKHHFSSLAATILFLRPGIYLETKLQEKYRYIQSKISAPPKRGIPKCLPPK